VTHQTPTTPPLGARFEFRPFRGARRVYELVESLSAEQAASKTRCGSDRHTIRVVVEEGFPVDSSYGIGFELHVEGAWFSERTDARRVAA
jgi:hypothetical protein